MDAWGFLLIAFASYRVTRLIIADRITSVPREALEDALARRASKPWAGWLLELLDCPWCMSVWVTGVAVAVFASVDQLGVDATPSGFVTAGVYWMALAASVGIISVLVDRVDPET